MRLIILTLACKGLLISDRCHVRFATLVEKKHGVRDDIKYTCTNLKIVRLGIAQTHGWVELAPIVPTSLSHRSFTVFMSLSIIFSYVRMGLPGLNQYYARINVSCSRTQHSDVGEAQTCGLSVSSQALYHWATVLPQKQVIKHFCKQRWSRWNTTESSFLRICIRIIS